MGKDLDDLEKKLNRIQNHLGEEIVPALNKLFEESVRNSLISWYNDYSPSMYDRTHNLFSILDSVKTIGKGNVIIMSVDSENMNDYLGFEIPPYEGYKKQPLKAETAFDFMFMNGEHGHGRWMMHQSTPPYIHVESDIHSGFNGQVNKIVNKTIENILTK